MVPLDCFFKGKLILVSVAVILKLQAARWNWNFQLIFQMFYKHDIIHPYVSRLGRTSGEKILLKLNVCINEGFALGRFKRYKLPFREIIFYC